MSKLNYLLHSITIINFALLAKLVTRYKRLTVLGLVAVLGLIPFFYFKQPVVFQKEVYFTVTSPSLLPRENNELPELDSGVGPSAIIASVTSYDFLSLFAKHVLHSPFFNQLDFRHPVNDEAKREAIKSCQNEECYLKNLRPFLQHHYSVSYDQVTGRYTVKILSRSSLTTIELLKSFIKAMEEIRQKNAALAIDKKIKQVQLLLSNSRSEIEAKSGFEKNASAEFLTAQISQQEEKIKSISARLFQDKNQYYNQRIRLRESSIASQNNIDGREKLNYEYFVKIKRKVDDLRLNIASINSIPSESRTSSDKLILEQLRSELETQEAELRRIGNLKRNLAQDETFIEGQRGSKSSLEFDHKVTSAYIKKLREEYDEANKYLDELYSKKAELEKELITLKPDIEYLNLLESKLVVLKIKQSSITSDVNFEQYSTEIGSFKRNSLLKISFFCFVLVSFVMLNLYLLTYFLDDKIYEELEVRRCIEELPVVGHAPYFD